MIRLLHVIAGLELGGAQMVLYRLLRHLDRSLFQPRVISLTDIGVVGRKIQDLGVAVEALRMRPGVPDPRGLFRLAGCFRRWPADVIHTWMYHSDLLGGLAAWIARSPKPVWGVRYGRLDPRTNNLHTRLTARVCARLSAWLPARIVCCSEPTLAWHLSIGYAAEKMLAIPNGVDVETFRPDELARSSVRRELGLPDDARLVGLVARWDPQKDHRTFVRAAALLLSGRPDVRFLLCGQGVTWGNAELARWIQEAGLRERFHLLGERTDSPRLTAALDVAALCSTNEGFGNVVAEAMACGVPCVVTRTGEPPRLVGDTGRVVPPGEPSALAEALEGVLAMPPEDRRALGRLARRRVEVHYNSRECFARYQALYQRLASSRQCYI